MEVEPEREYAQLNVIFTSIVPAACQTIYRWTGRTLSRASALIA
jgi:hypothetical protein